MRAELLVLGAGPGGYSAAFRAADLGKRVVLVERRATLGGVCLNAGCIPSKMLLHAARVISETREMEAHGVGFAEPAIDLDRLRGWRDAIVDRLASGLAELARSRQVMVVHGTGRLLSANRAEAVAADGSRTLIDFTQAIVAAGSEAATLPWLPSDPRIMDSTGALGLADLPSRLLIVGGGVVGLEMASVYSALGSRVTVVEMTDQIIPGADPDIVRPLQRRIEKAYAGVHLSTRVAGVEARADSLEVQLDGPRGGFTDVFDRILVAIGRTPNGRLVGAEDAGLDIDDHGQIVVDRQMRTSVPHIFAIGDVVGGPMLAHKASHEGHVAAEAAAGRSRRFDARAIPSVAYTDPEVAWTGMTESEARAANVDYGRGIFPWAASGRALSIGRDEGLTKLLFDAATGRVIGCGMVGPSASDLIGEVTLAIEMGADASDIGLTIHPHPTLSETIGKAAEVFEATITDLQVTKSRG